MVSFYGDYNLTETVNIPFNTFSSDDPSASVTVTDLANTDIYVHKDGVEGTPTGITASLNVGSVNGNHLAVLDLSDTNDAGFYAVGSRYQVRMEGVTIDGATVNAWIGAFSIGCTLRPTTVGRTLDIQSTGEVDSNQTMILGTALTETSGYLAAGFKKFFNIQTPTGTINSLPDAVAGATGGLFIAGTNAETTVTTAINANLIGNITGNLSGSVGSLVAAGLQDIAQITNRTAGVVYHVKASGGSDGSGLSWDDAYLHTTTSAKTVIEAASANDVVILGPGTFALGDNIINVPDNVSVFGAGMNATWLTSTAELTQAGEGAILKPGSNSLILDMTVEGTLDDGTYQAAIGANITGQSSFTNADARRCRFIADADGTYVAGESACSLTLIDCIVNTKYDCIAAMSSNAVVTAIRTICVSEGPSATSPGGRTRGINAASGGLVRLIDCHVHATDGGATETIGYHCGSNGSIEVYGGTVYTAGGAGNIYDADNGGTLLVLAGVDYDRAKTNGTITHVSSAESALVAKNLDHLMKTPVADTSDMTAEVADDTVLSCLMSSSNTTSTFVVADDSLQGISEGAAGGGATADEVWAGAIPASPNANTAAHYLQLIDAVLSGVTNTDTANQVAFKNRSGVEVRRITFGSSDGSRTASTIS